MSCFWRITYSQPSGWSCQLKLSGANGECITDGGGTYGNNERCTSASNGICEDGGPGSESNSCYLGSALHRLRSTHCRAACTAHAAAAVAVAAAAAATTSKASQASAAAAAAADVATSACETRHHVRSIHPDGDRRLHFWHRPHL